MKTYKIELTPMEIIQIQMALDQRLARLFIRLEASEDTDEIQFLDDQLEICRELARKISKETAD